MSRIVFGELEIMLVSILVSMKCSRKEENLDCTNLIAVDNFPNILFAGPWWTLLDRVGPCWIMLEHVGPCWTTLDHAGSSELGPKVTQGEFSGWVFAVQ